MPVRIVTDSSSDLTDQEVQTHGIEVVPLSIRFGAEEFEDRTELSVEAFYELFFYSIVIGLPMYELYKGAESAEKKETKLKAKI